MPPFSSNGLLQVRLVNSQRRRCISPEHDKLLLEDADIMSYGEAVLMLEPEDDTIGYVASVGENASNGSARPRVAEQRSFCRFCEGATTRRLLIDYGE